jgi:biotin synthase-related radical SAM superfamily protein
VIILAVYVAGRKISDTKVLAEVCLSRLCVPNTGNDCCCAVEGICIRVVRLSVSELVHTLHCDHTSIRVEVIVNVVEVTLGVHGPLRMCTCAEEEGCCVPAVLKSKTE